MLNNIHPETSGLLISEPFMLDPNFRRSVVLLADHNDEGTIGYVMNQRSDAVLAEIMPDCETCDLPVYVGGPVATDTLHFIHCRYDKIDSGAEIGKGLFWGGNFERVKELLRKGEINDNDIRFFVGYSGWEPGQLDQELNQNAWLVSDKYNPGLLFMEEGDQLWKSIIMELGPRYQHIVNFPETPMWN